MTATVADLYARHDPLTDPGGLAALFDPLPSDPAALRAIASGLIVHVAWASRYGIPPDTLVPRETQAVAERLRLIQSVAAGPLAEARPAARRSFGTCRDYALMLCSMLRHRAIPARVRCGFATYFEAAVPYEDHWICEYWSTAAQRWLRADAQLDALHRRHLGIGFDSANLPDGTFLSANEAWREVRRGAIAAEAFGHGAEGSGLWFLCVNVHRDLLALAHQQTSAWDSWRCATEASKTLDAAALAAVDDLAQAADTAARDADGVAALMAIAPAIQTPPWRL